MSFIQEKQNKQTHGAQRAAIMPNRIHHMTMKATGFTEKW